MTAGGGAGAILLRAGVVDEAGLAKAAEIQARGGGTLGRPLADDYLPKPVEPRRLAARIKALLARR